MLSLAGGQHDGAQGMQALAGSEVEHLHWLKLYAGKNNHLYSYFYL